MPNVFDTLQERGLFEASTSPELQVALNQPMTMYAGFDPTSESLQAGNFVTIMALCHFQRAGHKVIALVGGATGLIGDPSGKTSERQLLTEEQVERNLVGIKENLSRFIDFSGSANPAVMVNNYDWHKQFTFISYLRDVGRYFRMGTMLSKDSVKGRLNSESGMSFTEFCYQTLQGYDFLHLYDHHGCRLQIGGSDQWGNITAGTELIRRQRGVEAFGLTFPLVTDSQGRKFGKSEGNAIYLDPRKTSYYDFYQFFLRTEDADVCRYLRIFTFLPLAEIEALAETVRTQPEKREAQRILAEDLTRRVHGEVGLTAAQRATGVLFGGSMDGLRAADLLPIFANVPSSTQPRDAVVGKSAVEVAALSGLCKSKGEARRLADSGGLYVNNERVGASDLVAENHVIDGQLLVLRSGRKTYCVVKIGA
jgi:tyrosyl-tRNA synthetase